MSIYSDLSHLHIEHSECTSLNHALLGATHDSYYPQVHGSLAQLNFQ